MNNQNPSSKITTRSGNFIQELTSRFRLIGRLIMDPRVHPFVKVLPIASLAYVIWPVDVPGPFDDALVLWAGTTLFVQLCPPDVVEEHLNALRPHAVSDQWQGSIPPTGTNSNQPQSHEDIVDGTYYEGDPHKPQDSHR